MGERTPDGSAAPGQKNKPLRILIVDDESFVRAGLIKNIPWDSLGVSAIEQADDGGRAVALAERSAPDIVLSDIRMPTMDGLEMAARIRAINPRCKIIFMSAYSDKEYLKSAISLGAISYVEKPIDIAEVTQAIGRAASLLLEQKVQEEYARNAILLELVSGTASADRISEFLRLAEKSISPENGFVVSVLRFPPSQQSHSPRHLSLEEIDHLLAARGAFSASEFSADDAIVTIIGGDQVFSHGGLHTIGSLLASVPAKGQAFYIGVGEPVRGPEDIRHSYKTALAASEHVFLKGLNTFTIYDSRVASDELPYDRILEDFSRLLEQGQTRAAKELIRTVTRNARRAGNLSPSACRALYGRMLDALLEDAQRRGMTPSPELSQARLGELLRDLLTAREMEEFLIAEFDSLLAAMNNARRTNATVAAVVKVLRNSYSDHQLSIKCISDTVRRSRAYLCVIFKRETGKTINEYLTDLRVRKAEELLRDRQIKLLDVAQRVGYLDNNYFTKVFRRATGMTPSEFRRSYLV